MILLEQPLKITKSPISTPKKYDIHPYHPNIGSTPRGFLLERTMNNNALVVERKMFSL